MLDPKILFWMAASVANTAVNNLNCTKKLLAKSLCIFSIKGKPVFSNGSGSLPKNFPNYIILESWIFENFILSD